MSRRAGSLVSAALLALGAGMAAAGPAGARPLDEVVAGGVLHVAVYESNKPFSYTENGQPQGIDVDLAKALAEAIGVKATFIARMQGEDVDTDLRSNVWKGPVTGGPVGDVMMHVPLDRELALRNREAALINPYFEERIALFYDPARTGDNPGFDTFKREKIGVQIGTVSDYFLMFALDGALRNNVLHYIKISDGVRRFASGEMAAVLGVRSELEAYLKQAGLDRKVSEPAMPGIVRSHWAVGMAVKENSRDLGYALGNALTKLKQAGKLAEICSRYGVTYVAPRP